MTMQIHTEAFVPESHFIASGAAGKISLGHNGRDFFVIDSKNLKSEVSRMNLSKELRGISLEELEKALSVGYLAVTKIGEEHAVRFNARLAGGGPFLGFLAGAGTAIAGATLIGIGIVTTPVGLGVPLVAAGGVMVANAPVVGVAVALSPTP